jgi:hypothetical protein
MQTTNSIITITTQRDLDEALERRIQTARLAPDADVVVRSGDINLIVTSGSPHVKTLDTRNTQVVARDNSSPRVIARHASSPRVLAFDDSRPRVVARNFSRPRVLACHDSIPRIEAFGRSSPIVEAWGTSRPRVVARGDSSPRLDVFGESTPRVEACGSWIGPCTVPMILKNRDDLYHVLDVRPNEVEGLRAALVAGRVNGSCYEGECSCLLGTLSRCAGVPVDALGIHRDPSRPAEALFAPIRPGMTPENCPLVAVIVGWIDQWIARRR